MILSYNAKTDLSLSSVEEKINKENIKIDSMLSPKDRPITSMGFRSCSSKHKDHIVEILIPENEMHQNEKMFALLNPNISPLNHKRNYSTTSNENSFSGKEDNFLQKDVLNLINSSLTPKRSASIQFEVESTEKNGDKIDSFSSSSSILVEMQQKDSQLSENKSNMIPYFSPKKNYEYAPMEYGILPKWDVKEKDEKVLNISLDGSIISDVSHGSKNYIPKSSLLQVSQEKTCNNEEIILPKVKSYKRIKQNLKPDPMAYYNESSPYSRNVKMKYLDEKKKEIQENATISKPSLESLQHIPRDKNDSSSVKDDLESSLDHQFISYFSNLQGEQIQNPAETPSFPENIFIQRNNTGSIVYPNISTENKYRPEDIQKDFKDDNLYKNVNTYISNANFNSRVFATSNNNTTGNSTTVNPQGRETQLRNGNGYFSNSNSSTKLLQNKLMAFNEMSTDDLISNCLIIGQEQAGCRFLQKKIEENPSLANDILFFAVFDKLNDLMFHGFGNYFVQKIIEHISEDKLERVVIKIAPEFYDLGLDPYGTRVLQKIIDSIKSERLLHCFTELLIPNLSYFINNANACHILIKYATTIPSPANNIIYDYLNQNVVESATQKYSCCVLQKCIEAADTQQKLELFHTIADQCEMLITDQFGNYVVQFVITFGDFQVNAKIVSAFLNDIGVLSRQKCSSNVIEKCFNYCDATTKFLMVKELCQPRIISELLFDNYGNYVLQKALANAVEPYRTVFLTAIAPLLEMLKSCNFGSKLCYKLMLTYPELKLINKRDGGDNIASSNTNLMKSKQQGNVSSSNGTQNNINMCNSTNIPMNFNPYMNQGINNCVMRPLPTMLGISIGMNPNIGIPNQGMNTYMNSMNGNIVCNKNFPIQYGKHPFYPGSAKY